MLYLILYIVVFFHTQVDDVCYFMNAALLSQADKPIRLNLGFKVLERTLQHMEEIGTFQMVDEFFPT